MDLAAQSPAKRPKLVWVVFLFYLFSVVYTALSFFLVFSGLVSVTPEQAGTRGKRCTLVKHRSGARLAANVRPV